MFGRSEAIVCQLKTRDVVGLSSLILTDADGDKGVDLLISVA